MRMALQPRGEAEPAASEAGEGEYEVELKGEER